MKKSVELILNEKLAAAITKYKLLLDNGFDRQASLTLIQTKYNLSHIQRQLLYRSIHPDSHNKAVLWKTRVPWEKNIECIAVDYYNVAITILEAMEKKNVYRGTDGYTRDLAKVLGRSRKEEEKLDKATDKLLGYLSKQKIGKVFLITDKQVSHSAEKMAYARRLGYSGIQTLLSPRVDSEIIELSKKNCVAASSDTIILEKSLQTMDLAYHVIVDLGLTDRIIDVWRLPLHYNIV